MYEDCIIQGHVLDILRCLPDESVQCVVTSPPYWGLRDYKSEPLVWGGEDGCEHKWEESERQWGGGPQGATVQRANRAFTAHGKPVRQGGCAQCGAWRGSLGLEPTPDLYVQHLVEIFREVRRVLRDDGTVWLNLGNSYAASGQNSGSTPDQLTKKQRSNAGCRYERRTAPPGMKPKDLVGSPWMVALALGRDFIGIELNEEYVRMAQQRIGGIQ